MKAMVFTGTGKPLVLSEVEATRPGDDQVLIRVAACAVCRTDLHIVDGELTKPKLLDGRDLQVLPLGPREPLRPRTLHRLPD
jgi:D-arabinose 1-dehydrogenase-like Zn-dependent alcohol dehydrogenase